MSSPSETTVEHAQRRLGLLTSSAAKIVMHGSERAWKSLSQKLWTERPEDFNRALSMATEYGHAHEAEGAAKFWESHPWVESMREDTFFTLRAQNAPLGSSPDRVLLAGDSQMFGLEIKSPTSDANFDSHNLKAHFDQCQHGMLVTGFKAWYLFVHLHDRVAEWKLEPDARWQEQYLKRAEAFWKYHVITGKLPCNRD